MTLRALVEKLADMRRAAGDGEVTRMTHLYALIFHAEIGSLSGQIVKEYNRRHPTDPEHYPGKANAVGLLDGINLAPYVAVRPEHLDRWKK